MLLENTLDDPVAITGPACIPNGGCPVTAAPITATFVPLINVAGDKIPIIVPPAVSCVTLDAPGIL